MSPRRARTHPAAVVSWPRTVQDRREIVDLGPDAGEPRKRENEERPGRKRGIDETEHKEKPCVCVVYTGRP